LNNSPLRIMNTPPSLVLASSSPYRAQLLERLGIEFETVVSGIDETRRAEEDADALVRRLARTKAEHVAAQRPGAAVLGADQVAVFGDRILGKPGDRDSAIARLREMSGQRVDFLSGIAFVCDGQTAVDVVPTRLVLRELGEDEIERYVDRDRPLDCAGGMRSESLGISLLSSLTSDDPTALIGLPLIRVCQWLRGAGFAVP
jgi:septum formation protein